MVVDLCGGLGNQMFQYAFGRSVALARNEELFFSKDDCGGTRPYALDVFNVKIQWAEGRTGPLRGEPIFKFDPSVYTEPNGLRYRGYWQTEKYFNELVIQEDLKFVKTPCPHVAFSIESMFRNSCAFIHVRRGDYTKEPHLSFHGSPSMNYYNKAVNKIRGIDPNVIFLVFSDDPDWCRSNFLGDCIIMEGHKPFEDMWLMSKCQHGVIANSSFGWWGAWLGPDKNGGTVIAPQKWFKDPSMCYQDVVPDRWIKLEN